MIAEILAGLAAVALVAAGFGSLSLALASAVVSGAHHGRDPQINDHDQFAIGLGLLALLLGVIAGIILGVFL